MDFSQCLKPKKEKGKKGYLVLSVRSIVGLFKWRRGCSNKDCFSVSTSYGCVLKKFGIIDKDVVDKLNLNQTF